MYARKDRRFRQWNIGLLNTVRLKTQTASLDYGSMDRKRTHLGSKYKNTETKKIVVITQIFITITKVCSPVVFCSIVPDQEEEAIFHSLR